MSKKSPRARGDKRLERLSPCPKVREQLQAALRPSEIEYLLRSGLVIEKLLFAPRDAGISAEEPVFVLYRAKRNEKNGEEYSFHFGDFDQLRTIIREITRTEKKLFASMERRERKERRRLRPLGLSPQEEELFRALERERDSEDGGLSESEAAEIVYHLEWYWLDGDAQAQLKVRLQTLERSLNDKLLVAKSTVSVVRSQLGRLVLHDSGKNWKAAEAAENRRFQERLEANAALRESLTRLFQSLPPDEQAAILGGGKKETEADDPPRTIEECMALIREYLATGPQDSNALNRHCEAQGCRPSTVRRARTRLALQTVRVGYGAEGKWLVSLPA